VYRELRAKDPQDRASAAVQILKDIDPGDKEALDVLGKGIRAGHGNWSPARTTELSRTNPAVLKLMLDAAMDRKVPTSARHLALSCLRSAGPLPKDSVPGLIACLDEPYPIGATAAEALATMKTDANAAIKPLEDRVKKNRGWQLDLNIASMARALAQIDRNNETALNYHVRLLRGSFYEHRSTGVFGLRECDSLPPRAIEELKRIAENDPYENLRDVAREILAKQKPPSEKSDAR
jgi:HEAT repeat protein